MKKKPEKIQHPCMTKTLRKTGIEGHFIKNIYRKPIPNLILSERLDASP